MLLLTRELANRIRAHSAAGYPQECCGALLGRDQEGGRQVVELLPLVNRRDDSPRSRFSITPEDFRIAENAARTRGLELIGWYHSHPDHPARPSEYDREHAWPWYSYVIVSVNEGEPGEVTSWRLADDRTRFLPEEITVQPGSASGAGQPQGARSRTESRLAPAAPPKAFGG
jgi:proteasome lid subunit RPN8/RPN11